MHLVRVLYCSIDHLEVLDELMSEPIIIFLKTGLTYYFSSPDTYCS